VPGGGRAAAALAEIGIAAGSHTLRKLSLEDKLAVGDGIKEGFAKIKEKRGLGRRVNGWRITEGPGDRAAYHGIAEAAAVALAGIYANDAVEALYPIATRTSRVTSSTAAHR